MPAEHARDEAKNIWRNQASEDSIMTLDDIHAKAQKFQTQVRWRNVREYIAAGFVVLVFGFYFAIFPGWMMKTGSALSIVAALFVARQLHKRGSARALTANSGLSLVDFHRAELTRQRDLLRSVGRWYLAPFVPGCLLLFLGRYFQFHVAGRTLSLDHEIILRGVVVVAIIFGIVWLLNAWVAERLQRRIEQLDGLRSGSAQDSGQ